MGAEIPGATKVSPAAIVIKGQWVKNEEGKDLIIMDPTDQPYDVLFADRATNSVTKFEKDDDDKWKGIARHARAQQDRKETQTGRMIINL